MKHDFYEVIWWKGGRIDNRNKIRQTFDTIEDADSYYNKLGNVDKQLRYIETVAFYFRLD